MCKIGKLLKIIMRRDRGYCASGDRDQMGALLKLWTAGVSSLVLLWLISACSAQYDHTIYVDPVRGHNSTACLNSSLSRGHPCRNLSYAFQYRNSSTRYLLQPGTHYLDTTVSFTALNDIAISGNGTVGEVKILCTSSNSTGLGFDHVHRLLFENVTISNCSAIQNSTSRNFSAHSDEFKLSQTRVALYVNHCSSLVMEYVHVTDNHPATGVLIYNTNGTNNFTKCNFSGNVASTSDSYPSGGGVYVEFSYCLPGDNSCENNSIVSYADNNAHSTYSFTECTFADNQATTGTGVTTAPTFIVPHQNKHVAFSRGGGLSIFFNGNATGNVFTVNGCIFESNVAQYGAGMFVEFHDSSCNNKVFVNGTSFVSNRCEYVAGGGMRIAHYVYENTSMGCSGNSVEVNLSNFTHNSANNGGGISLSPSRQNCNDSRLFSLLVTKTNFTSNRATYGAALKVELFSLIVKGMKPTVTLFGCTFSNNTVYRYTYHKPHEVGIGAVYINHLDVFISGVTLFEKNNGSALALVDSSTHIFNTAYFYGNSGRNGGAMALLGSARIIVSLNSTLSFIGNAALDGGAIFNTYTDRNDYKESSECFVVHSNPFISADDWQVEFYFLGNVDSTGRNAIYSTSILPCAFSGGTGEAAVDKILCWEGWTYNGGKNCSNFIRTGPGTIVSDRLKPVGGSGDSNRINITAYSGQLIKLYLRAMDDLNHTLPVVYTATASVNQSLTGVKVDPDFVYVSQNLLRVYKYRQSGTNATVALDTIGDRSWHIEMDIELQDCPLGLLPTHIQCNSSDAVKLCITCECNSTYKQTVHCRTPTNASLASGYWMGTLKGKQCSNETCVVVGECPPGFCRSTKYEFIPLPLSGPEEHICGPQNRTGVLCGRCIDGYGPSLNSETYDCVSCNLSSTETAIHTTYYILAVYVPLFLLFLGIIVFNIKLTTGPANAFILYSQVISSTFDLNAEGKIHLSAVIAHAKYYLIAYKFPYGIFNLEFFEQFVSSRDLCLGAHLNVLDIMLLDLIVAFSPLLMIITTVVFYKLKWYCCSVRNPARPRRNHGKRWKKLGRVGNALLPAFASFILLSYTKFSLTASYLSVSTRLYDANGDAVGSRHVYYAGQYSATDSMYVLFYQMPSILIFLTFVAIPPLLLLDYPLTFFERQIIQRVSFLRKHYPRDKIQILLDTFQGCYKNRWRCFAGLYFVFRLLINVTYIFADLLTQFALQGLYCVVWALLVAYLKPYRRKFHLYNYVDSLVFLNLAVINQITFYLFATTRNGTPPSVTALAVQYVLVFLPLLYMVSYIVWWLLPIPNVRARARQWMVKRQRTQRLENLIQSGGGLSSTPEPPDDDVDWERAEETNRYSPILRVSSDQESLKSTSGSSRTSGQHTQSDSGVVGNRTSSSSGKTASTRHSYGSTGTSKALTSETPPEQDT